MKMVKLKLIALMSIVMAMMLVVSQRANGVMVDQEMRVFKGPIHFSGDDYQVGQSFVPTITRHVGVELYFAANDEQPMQADITIQLHLGNILDPVVGGSIVNRSLSLNADRQLEVYQFFFDSPIDLIPGNSYSIEIIAPEGVVSGDTSVLFSNPPDHYPFGQQQTFQSDGGFGVSIDADIMFATLVIPEPSAGLLMLPLMGLVHRRRLGG